MHCPRCNERTRVLESRNAESGAALRRRRRCTSCGHRFTTFERREPEPLFIRKRDGSRQRYDRAKLCGALERAAHKRDIDHAELARIADEAEAMIAAGGGELSSDAIALHCLESLESLDRGAYLQYAGTLPEPNAQFARVPAAGSEPRSVRSEGDHGQSTPKAGPRRGLDD
jgi:transcriptional regulator NrdR